MRLQLRITHWHGSLPRPPVQPSDHVPRPHLDSPSRIASDPLVEPLRPGSGAPLAAQAYEAIRGILFRGRYQQGEALRMDELCERLGASRQPIMDALKRLAHEGYLTIIPQVGCKVRVYTRDEVREYFRLYAAADGLLAELAAQRASDEDLERLAAISEQIAYLVRNPAPGNREALRYRQLNRDFHQQLRGMANSWPVAELAAQMNDRSDFFTVTMRHAIRADRVQRGHIEHERLIAALRSRNAPEARACMEQHIMAVGERLWEAN